LPEALQKDQSLLLVDSFDPARSSRCFSIMLQGHLAHLGMPALVKGLHCDAPLVRLDVLPWQSPTSMKPGRFRSIDLLISCSTNEIAEFHRETLFTDTGFAVVGKGQPVASLMKNLKAFLNLRRLAVVRRG
jgi:hypothetical protein